MQITQMRTADHIDFFETGIVGAASIATLFDGHETIIFDQAAEDFSAAVMDRSARNLAHEFAMIGLDVATARMIDAMPSPMETIG